MGWKRCDGDERDMFDEEESGLDRIAVKRISIQGRLFGILFERTLTP